MSYSSLTRKRSLRDSYADKLRRDGIPQKARKPLRAVSEKRLAENRQYSKCRRVFLDNNPKCQVCLDRYEQKRLILPCTGVSRSTQVHHMDGREHGLLLDESKWMPICNIHHHWVHAHPNEARQRGWLV